MCGIALALAVEVRAAYALFFLGLFLLFPSLWLFVWATRPADMLDVLLGSGLPDADVLYTLVDLFVAGVNTISSTLSKLSVSFTVTLGLSDTMCGPMAQARWQPSRPSPRTTTNTTRDTTSTNCVVASQSLCGMSLVLRVTQS